MEVRVVLNAGEVRAEPRDVFGEPVHIAQRVEEVADANEVTLTEAVFLVINKAEVPSVELGHFELRGINEKVKLFRIPRGGRSAGNAPANPNHASLPFGGVGLERAGKLPETDLATIERALVARQSRRALVAQAQRYVRSPEGIKVTVAIVSVILLAVVGLGVRLAMKPKVERALDAGKMAEARELVALMPKGADRTYWQARLDEKDDAGRAIHGYVSVAHDAPEWVKPSIERLGLIAKSGNCEIKVRVADALGELGESAGKSVLDDIAKEQPEKDDSLFGRLRDPCDPAKHAQKALEKISTH